MPDLPEITQRIVTPYDSAGILAFITDLGVVSGVAVVAAASVALVVGASVEAVKTTMDWGESLKDVTLKLGGTTEQAAGYKLMSDAAGMSVDDFTRSLDLMSKNLELVSGKEGNAAKEMDNMHITYRNADGTLMDSTVIFQNIADKLSTMADGQEKTRIEMDIFGRSGAQMGLLLENAANGGMQHYIDQAKAMGLALSDTQVEQIKHLNEDLATMKDQFTGIAVILGSAMVPAVDALIGWIGRLVTSLTPAIQQFGQFLGVVLGVQGATASATATSAGTPASGSPGGTQLAPWATQADIAYAMAHPEKYYIPGTAAGSAGIPSNGPADQGHGASLVPTGFEMSLLNFEKGLEAVPWQSYATAVQNFVTAIPWTQIVAGANATAAWMNNFVKGPTQDSHLYPPGYTGAKPGDTPLSIAGGDINANFGDFFNRFGTWISGGGDPPLVTDKPALTHLGSMDTSLSTLNAINVSNAADTAKLMQQMKDLTAGTQKSIDANTVVLQRLPANIRDAIRTGQ